MSTVRAANVHPLIFRLPSLLFEKTLLATRGSSELEDTLSYERAGPITTWAVVLLKVLVHHHAREEKKERLLMRLLVTTSAGREYVTTVVAATGGGAASVLGATSARTCDIVLGEAYVRPAPRCEEGKCVVLRVAVQNGTFDHARALRKYADFAKFLFAERSASGSKAALVRGVALDGKPGIPLPATSGECHVVARRAADNVLELVLTHAGHVSPAIGASAASAVAASSQPSGAVAPVAPAAAAAAAAATDPPRRRSRYAAVFLVMKGDNYVPGALVAGHSWKLSGSQADTLCMVTSDVSAAARSALRKVFDDVREVEYIRARHKPLKTKKQRQYYDQWVGEAFTKWQMLQFTEYEKVLFIDADKLILTNMDSLFELRAPAGTFSTPWSQPWRRGGMPNPYARHFDRAGLRGEATHGAPIPRSVVREGLERAFVLIGT